jgi:hypothetical protein
MIIDDRGFLGIEMNKDDTNLTTDGFDITSNKRIYFEWYRDGCDVTLRWDSTINEIVMGAKSYFEYSSSNNEDYVYGETLEENMSCLILHYTMLMHYYGVVKNNLITDYNKNLYNKSLVRMMQNILTTKRGYRTKKYKDLYSWWISFSYACIYTLIVRRQTYGEWGIYDKGSYLTNNNLVIRDITENINKSWIKDLDMEVRNITSWEWEYEDCEVIPMVNIITKSGINSQIWFQEEERFESYPNVPDYEEVTIQ